MYRVLCVTRHLYSRPKLSRAALTVIVSLTHARCEYYSQHVSHSSCSYVIYNVMVCHIIAYVHVQSCIKQYHSMLCVVCHDISCHVSCAMYYTSCPVALAWNQVMCHVVRPIRKLRIWTSEGQTQAYLLIEGVESLGHREIPRHLASTILGLQNLSMRTGRKDP